MSSDTDVLAVGKMAYFYEKKGNNSWSHRIIWIILELNQDILVLSIVSKFRKVPFEMLMDEKPFLLLYC